MNPFWSAPQMYLNFKAHNDAKAHLITCSAMFYMLLLELGVLGCTSTGRRWPLAHGTRRRPRPWQSRRPCNPYRGSERLRLRIKIAASDLTHHCVSHLPSHWPQPNNLHSTGYLVACDEVLGTGACVLHYRGPAKMEALPDPAARTAGSIPCSSWLTAYTRIDLVQNPSALKCI